MRLVITFISNNRRLQRSISVRTLISATVLSSLFMLVSSRSTESVSEDIARVQLAQQKNSEALDQVNALERQAKVRFEQLVAHLAETQAQLYQLDGQSKFLAQELGLDSSAFEELGQTKVPIKNVGDPVMQQIVQLQQSVRRKQQQLSVLERLVRGHHIEQQSQLSGRPIESGWLSSYYGMREDPFSGEPAMHKGLDFAAEAGERVVATAAGIVTWAGKRYGYGQMVEIEHGNGLISRYGHNHQLSVAVGDVVTKGQVIAQIGSTGRSTGAHVHYEVIRNGQQIDPLPYLASKSG